MHAHHDLIRFARRCCSLGLALGLLTLVGCANPADDVPSAQVKPAETSAADGAVPPDGSDAGTPAVDATSDAAAASAAPVLDLSKGLPISTADSKIDFVGSKVTGSHSGGFKSFQGAIDIPDGKVESARIVAEIDINSMYTDNEKLTGHLKSADFFDAEKFPKAMFASTEIKPGVSDPKAPEATHMVSGDLTLHGVTQSIQFPAKIEATADSTSLGSEFSINRKDFGIVFSGMPNDLIRDEVVIKLDIHAKKSDTADSVAAPATEATN
jgi:polyisoprenoid-binding protein YceI